MDAVVQTATSKPPESREPEGKSAWLRSWFVLGVSPIFKEWLLSLAICCPAMVLLMIPGQEFGLDWPGHLWMAAYHGEYFRQHLAFPSVLNTDYVCGMPFPVFYGFLFFPAAGLLSIPLGADAAMKLIVATVMIVQCRQVFLLLRAVGGSLRSSWLVAALVSWSTYGLTNLYSRGALPEYIGVALLTCLICLFGRMFLGAAAWETSRSLRLEAFLLYALCAGVHPLTAVFGGLFIGLAVLAMLPFQEHRWRMIVWGAVGVLGVLLVLSPWLYATATFYRSLAFYQATMREIIHFTRSIDLWWVRLAPFPLDVRMSAGQLLRLWDTPYMDAQLNFPLLILALVFSARLKGARSIGCQAARAGWALWVICWLLFLVTLITSVSPFWFGWLPGFFHNLQFAYRLVSYQNLALLGIVAGAAAVLLRRGATGGNGLHPAWLLVCGSLGVLGLGMKLMHVSAVMHDLFPDSRQWRENPAQLVHLPNAFYGWPAYAVLGPAVTNCHPTTQILLQPGTGNRFGKVDPVQFQLEGSQEVALQVQPFPWNQMKVDGQALAGTERCRRPFGYVVSLEPGRHEVAYEWCPDPVWAGLDMLSKWVMLGWVSLVIGVRWFNRHHRADQAVASFVRTHPGGDHLRP